MTIWTEELKGIHQQIKKKCEKIHKNIKNETKSELNGKKKITAIAALAVPV
jgi:hypothetical protein